MLRVRIIALYGCMTSFLAGCMGSGVEEDASETAAGQGEAIDETSSAIGPPHFQILGAEPQVDCGSVTPVIDTLAYREAIGLLFSDLRVHAPGDPHRSCTVRLHVRLDPGYELSLDRAFYRGRADIDPAGGRGIVSARANLDGSLGIDGFLTLAAGYENDFTVDLVNGTPSTVCGADTYVYLRVDLTAHEGPSDGGYSEIDIQQGSVSFDPERCFL